MLVGHFPLSGIGANDRYEIYGNFFYQNPVEALFQGEGNLVLHDNLFVNSTGSAVNIQAHNDKPRAVTVYHNTIVAAGNGIRISGADPAYVQKIIANAAFAGTPITGPNQQANITGTYASAATCLNAPTAPIGSLDLFPKAGQLSGPAVDIAQFTGFIDGDRDLNGEVRTGIFCGAYDDEGTNPGWRPALAIKPASGGPPSPSITLTADPDQVSLQGSSTLTWPMMETRRRVARVAAPGAARSRPACCSDCWPLPRGVGQSRPSQATVEKYYRLWLHLSCAAAHPST